MIKTEHALDWSKTAAEIENDYRRKSEALEIAQEALEEIVKPFNANYDERYILAESISIAATALNKIKEGE